jgi:hypothetical protein
VVFGLFHLGDLHFGQTVGARAQYRVLVHSIHELGLDAMLGDSDSLTQNNGATYLDRP